MSPLPYPIYCPLPLLHREEALTKPHWCLGREEREWIFVVEEWTSLDLHLHHSFFVADGNFNARAPYPPRTSLSFVSIRCRRRRYHHHTFNEGRSWLEINFVRASSCHPIFIGWSRDSSRRLDITTKRNGLLGPGVMVHERRACILRGPWQWWKSMCSCPLHK